MSSAIAVQDLGKCYQIDHMAVRAGDRMIRESIVGALRSTWDRVRRRDRAESREAFWALKGVNFEVQPGETLGIIGGNGAGKSTLLKILSQITGPTTGKIELRGQVASLLEVGTGFHPELTGRENIYLNGSILGMRRSEIDRKFDEIVAFSEIERFLDTPVKRYSSGMYVRLAFAVAAHLEPEILIVDEVLAVGDVAFQEKCLGKIGRNASNGRTTLYVSHNLNSVQQLCDRCIWLRSGQIVADGPPREIVRAYLTDLTQLCDTSVRDWVDRDTNGKARILDLVASDQMDGTTGCITLGCTLGLSIEAEFYEPVIDPLFGVLVHNRLLEPVLDVRSSHCGLRLGRVHGRVSIHATVEQLGLYPGEYLLSPWITDAASKVVFDWPKHCRTLHVDAGHKRACDLQVDAGFDRYWLPSQWSSIL